MAAVIVEGAAAVVATTTITMIKYVLHTQSQERSDRSLYI
jgi:hypothetical protein